MPAKPEFLTVRTTFLAWHFIPIEVLKYCLAILCYYTIFIPKQRASALCGSKPSLKFVYGFRIRKCKFLRIRFQMSFLICFSNLFFVYGKKCIIFRIRICMHYFSYMNFLCTYIRIWMSCTFSRVRFKWFRTRKENIQDIPIRSGIPGNFSRAGIIETWNLKWKSGSVSYSE